MEGILLSDVYKRQEEKPYVKNPQKYVMMPGMAKKRHPVVEQRIRELTAYAEKSDINMEIIGDTRIGIITSGAAFQYAREAMGENACLLYTSYPIAVKRLQIAIDQAREYGLLGKNIFDSGFDFDIEIRLGAGAFVCGEGSALTASIEGNRGMPRVKPPRTVEQGLFDKPTVLNNVETYANVPMIVANGADWFKASGTENNAGTKAFALTGSVKNTGLIEVPMLSLIHI